MAPARPFDAPPLMAASMIQSAEKTLAAIASHVQARSLAMLMTTAVTVITCRARAMGFGALLSTSKGAT